MSAKVNIRDSQNGINAKVTKRGQLVVSPLEFSTPVSKSVNATGTAFNFFIPESGTRFIITDVILSSDNTIGSNGAVVEIYEADAIDSATVNNSIVTLILPSRSNIPLLNLNWIVTEGKWLNVKTDDATIECTIAGYYVTA